MIFLKINTRNLTPIFVAYARAMATGLRCLSELPMYRFFFGKMQFCVYFYICLLWHSRQQSCRKLISEEELLTKGDLEALKNMLFIMVRSP